MRNMVLLLAFAAVSSCASAPPGIDNAQAQQRLGALLAAKVAGPPVNCIPAYQSNSPSVIAPQAIAFDVNPSTVYVANTAGSGCEGSTGPSLTLVSESRGPGGLCSGDQVRIVDHDTGAMVGSCVLPPFIPYTKG